MVDGGYVECDVLSRKTGHKLVQRTYLSLFLLFFCLMLNAVVNSKHVHFSTSISFFNLMRGLLFIWLLIRAFNL